MIREGERIVRLPWDGHRVHGPTVASSRPLIAASLFDGKSPAQVIAMVPLLFSICGGAQRAAASAALAAAGAQGTEREADAVGVVLETVQEYFWRLLIDWPQAMGREPLATPVAAARHSIAAGARDADGVLAWENAAQMRALGVALAAIATRSIYGMPPSQWLNIDNLGALRDWARVATTLPAALIAGLLDDTSDLGRSDVALMPVASEALIAAVVPAMVDPAFARAPTWRGAPVETGALARMASQVLVAAADARYGHAVVTRMVARLAELATMLSALARGSVADVAATPIQAFTLAADEGLAAVQTACGLLLHRARLSGKHVADYQIVAPTEWNFHPQGALVNGLGKLMAEDEIVLSRHARLAVQALDPCVGCRIEIGHAGGALLT